jgi:effector-binding domain-containing protein
MTDTIDTRQAKTPEIIDLVERPAAVVRIDATMEEFPRLIGEAFGLAAQAIQGSDATVAGHPFARYLSFGDRIEAEAGFPLDGTLVPTDRVTPTLLPGGRAVMATHVGAYDEIGAAWERTTAWMGEHGLEGAGPPWEAYLTGPEEPGPPVTEIFWPIR